MSLETAGLDDGHHSTAERLFELIRDRIVYGDLPPGSKITEAALAQAYGVNRAPLREAFLRLEERRLIEKIPFSGTRVFTPSTRMLRELFEVREVLEGFACRRVAETITPQQADDLMRMVEERAEMTISMDDRKLAAALSTLDIHLKIAELCGNMELQRILRSDVWMFLRANFRQWNRSAEHKRAGAAEHRDIVRAMAQGDGELASLLMRRHVARTREVWEADLGSRAPEGGQPARRTRKGNAVGAPRAQLRSGRAPAS